MTIETHLKNLSEIVAKENWSELTGPFFHVQIDEHEMVGPIKAADLKTYQENSPLPETTKIRDAKSLNGWQELYLHPLFQRRKPQILGGPEGEMSQVHIIVDGQVHGPLEMEQVTQMIVQNEIFLNDQVSFDQGMTWKKIFQIEQFDRRNFAQTELPSAPSWDVFRGSNDEISEELQSLTQENIETDAIAGLAFIENLNSGKTSQTRDRSYSEIEREADILNMPTMPMAGQQSSGPKFYYAMAIVLLLGASSFFFLNTPSKRAPASISESKESHSRNVNKASRKRSNYKAPRISAKSSPRSRKPASISASSSFRDANSRRMQDRARIENDDDNPYPDDYDYDQGNSPVEQDQIRKKLDKATIDPEENYYDEEEKEAFLDSQEESREAYNAGEISPSEVWGEEGREPAANEQDGEYNDFEQEEMEYENPDEVEFLESDY
jgi:hypothetical protein